MLSLSLLLVELNEENEVLEDDEGVNTLIMLVDDAEDVDDDTEDCSLLDESLKLALYLAHGLMGDTTVSLR